MNITNLDLTPSVLSFLKGIDFDVEYNVEQNIEERKKEAMNEIRDIRSVKPTISQIPLWKVKIDSFVERNKGTLATQLDPEYVSLNKLKVNIWNPDYDFQKIASTALTNRANTSIIETAIAEVQENSFNILYEKFQMILKFLMNKHPEAFKEVFNLEENSVSEKVSVNIVQEPPPLQESPIIKEQRPSAYGELKKQTVAIYNSGIHNAGEIRKKLEYPLNPSNITTNRITATISNARSEGLIKEKIAEDIATKLSQ